MGTTLSHGQWLALPVQQLLTWLFAPTGGPGLAGAVRGRAAAPSAPPTSATPACAASAGVPARALRRGLFPARPGVAGAATASAAAFGAPPVRHRPAGRPLRVHRLLDDATGRPAAARMVISGRIADVCAELDRLAAREAATGRH